MTGFNVAFRMRRDLFVATTATPYLKFLKPGARSRAKWHRIGALYRGVSIFFCKGLT